MRGSEHRSFSVLLFHRADFLISTLTQSHGFRPKIPLRCRGAASHPPGAAAASDGFRRQHFMGLEHAGPQPAFTVPAPAAIIDRIVVAIGKQVITETELELTIRITAFLNQVPSDFSVENRRKPSNA